MWLRRAKGNSELGVGVLGEKELTASTTSVLVKTILVNQ